MNFYDRGLLIGSVVLRPALLFHSSEATLTLSAFEPGCHSFVAYYSGNFDPNNSANNDDYLSVGTYTEVFKAPCSIGIQVDRATMTNENTAPTFTAGLQTSGHTGTVDFLDQNNSLYTRVAVSQGRFVTYTVPCIAVGTITLHARYYGDSHYLGCDSQLVQHTRVQGEVHYGEVFYPNVNDDAYTIDIAGSVTADVIANDVTFNRPVALSLVPAHGPSKGLAKLTEDHRIMYVPNDDFTSGTDTFDYRLTIADGSNSDGNSNDATVTVTVQCTAAGATDSYTVGHGQAAVFEGPGVLGNDKTCGGEAEVATLPAHGAVQLASSGSFTYTPDAAYEGPDSSTYTLTTDPDQTPVTVQLIVRGLVCTPLLVPDSYDAIDGGAVVPPPGVAANDALCGNVVALGSAPSHGTVEFGRSSGFRYTAEPGYSGPDSFTYGVADVPPRETAQRAGLLSTVATVTMELTVTADPSVTSTTSTQLPGSTPTAAPTPPEPASGAAAPLAPIELPATGAESYTVTLLASVLVLLGAVSIVLSRRRLD